MRPISRSIPTVAVLAAFALLAPDPATAQACGLVGGNGIDAAAGYARYDLGNGVGGPSVGADLAIGTPSAAIRAGYRRVLLDGASEPDIGRVAVAVPVLRMAGLVLCPVAHGGLSRVSLGEDAATIVGGGVGLRVSGRGWLGSVVATPFAEVRGLGATTTGSVLGADVDASGYAVGGAAGVQLIAGSLTLRLEGVLDGFDDGLGPTPYPNQAVELGVGVRF